LKEKFGGFFPCSWSDLRACFSGVIFRKCSVNSALRGGFNISGDGQLVYSLFEMDYWVHGG